MARFSMRKGAVGAVLFLFVGGFVLASEPASGERAETRDPAREALSGLRMADARSGGSERSGPECEGPPDRAAGFTAGTGASWFEDHGQPSPPRSFFAFLGGNGGGEIRRRRL
jgi:hypothetical protein